MTRRRAFPYLIFALFAVGIAQYAQVAIDSLAHGTGVYIWNLDDAELQGAGPVKYLKDLSILSFALIWPVAMGASRFPAGTRKLLSIYFAWLIALVCLGLVGFVAQWSPMLFLPAGIRWMILLHTSFGLFLFAGGLKTNGAVQTRLLVMLGALGAFDAYVVLQQYRTRAQLQDVLLSADRLIGLFSNAAVAGMFALSLGCMALILDRGARWSRISVMALAALIAISSGTRFAMLSISLLSGVFVWEFVDAKLRRNNRMLFLVIAVPVSLCLVVVGYATMVNAVGRGDVITNQLDAGGRLFNLKIVAQNLMEAQPGELLFGRGLGVGTNTAVKSISQTGIDPTQYRFNELIDNTFVTLIFQMGIVGCLLFSIGVAIFLWNIRPRRSKKASIRFVAFLLISIAACMDSNVLEQFYLMTTLAVAFGDTYWRSIGEPDAVPA
ncbi:O-antigen ligase family protein [Paraburkholderia sediminicola]|uniref:O-antigen ligase family protein n=1 Tax=Paraburkholderia sediminicola TaxID=458836 RepID=UPI000EAD43C8